MNLAEKVPLQPLRAGAVLQELTTHMALFWVAWYGGLGYFGIVLLLALELMLINLLSIALHQERGLGSQLRDLLGFPLVVAVLLVLVVVSYGPASGDGPVPPAALVERVTSRLDLELVRWTSIFTIVHLAVMMAYARTRADPRLAWAKLAWSQAPITFLAIFALILFSFFFGYIVTSALSFVAGRAVPVDLVLSVVAVSLRLACALLVSHLPEDAMEEIAAQPYAD